ncbi:nucleoplasmin-2-like [Eublepharis macularius]|uniref:Nucleoplasmin-2-like n=1 Tax=Eublepharis macularius TaxID=481883 RepID=A0AA97KZT2_EUBMA|nr:nucleoplasmin-2-like [Eublepharis macularius]
MPPKNSKESAPVCIANLKISVLPMVTTQGLDLNPPVTFRLRSGSGPVYLAGQHVTAVSPWNNTVEEEEEEEEEESQEDEEMEESSKEESPVKPELRKETIQQTVSQQHQEERQSGKYYNLHNYSAVSGKKWAESQFHGCKKGEESAS